MPVPLNSGSVTSGGSNKSTIITTNTSLTSLSSSNMNYIRHQGLLNSNSLNNRTSKPTSANTTPTSNTSTTTNLTTNTTPASSSFSKLRSNFIRPLEKDVVKKPTSTSTNTSSSKLNSNLKQVQISPNRPKLTLNSKSNSMVSSITENYLKNTTNNKFTKGQSISSSISNLINSDDELLNDKLNSATASTISSLSSEIQTENENEHENQNPINNNLLNNSQIKNLSETSASSIKSSSSSFKLKQTHQNNEQVVVSSTTPSSSSSPSSHRSSPTNKSAQMPFKIRSSKYRHVYGNPHKEDVCFKNIKITKNAAHDSAFCAVNPKFVAIVTEECGGGAFIVIPIKQTGRIDINMPKIAGHRGPVLDLKWNPFNDNEIASCSEDTTIKVWHVPDGGLRENLNEWVVDLHGHQRKVGQIEWHPTAENIMISSGADFQVILWNLEKAEPIRIISCHNDTIQSMNWNRDGSFFASTCKDKKLRVIDPRSGKVIAEGDGHQGSKISKVIILGCGTKMFTTGFSRLSERQIALWDIKDLSKPIQMDIVDCSSGILIPYYDYDTKIVFVAGKGDGNIRYYEITECEPYIHFLSEYKSSAPQRGLGWMPKRGLDVTKNEVFRFYKLHATGGICEPISMIVPRKSEVFQEDIYPDTASGIPSLSCDEWLSGENRDPILISMKDGAVPFMPKIVTYKQLGFSDLGSNSNCSRSLLNSNKIKLTSLTSTTTTTTTASITNKQTADTLLTSDQVDSIKSLKDYSSNSNQKQNNNKLTLSSTSAFNKMSSSSSFSSSPPSSPNQSRKYLRLNSDTFNDTTKMFMHNEDILNSSDESKTTPTTSNSITNHASSTESVNQDRDDYMTNSRKQSEEIEASYITNVSKNPITLRKTESLRIESVQSIRNRFDRVNSNTIGPLNRNKNIAQMNDFINSSTGQEESNTNESAPSPPTLILSPLAGSYTNGKPTTPIPLLINTSANSSINSSNNQTPNNNNNNNSSCIKKRVWTPVQSSSNFGNSKTNDLNSSPTNYQDLQKSYFRLLEERNNLKERNKKLEEELSMKEKRITMLEDRLKIFNLADSNRIELATDC